MDLREEMAQDAMAVESELMEPQHPVVLEGMDRLGAMRPVIPAPEGMVAMAEMAAARRLGMVAQAAQEATAVLVDPAPVVAAAARVVRQLAARAETEAPEGTATAGLEAMVERAEMVETRQEATEAVEGMVDPRTAQAGARGPQVLEPGGSAELAELEALVHPRGPRGQEGPADRQAAARKAPRGDLEDLARSSTPS